MNTIMITGTAKKHGSYITYDIHIWGSRAGEPIQFITGWPQHTVSGYDELWKDVKERAVEYLKEPRLSDGAYTQYLDHLIILRS